MGFSKWSHDLGLVLRAIKTKVMDVSSSQNRTEGQLPLFAHGHLCLYTKSHCCSCPTIEVVNYQSRYLDDVTIIILYIIIILIIILVKCVFYSEQNSKLLNQFLSYDGF